MPPTPPSEPAVPAVAVHDHLIVRPFIGDESTTCFENQPVPRPVLDVTAAAPKTLRVLDPSQKYKLKREVTAGELHWFVPDGDVSSSPVPPASFESATKGTAEAMAQALFDGYNSVAVVCGHAKSGKTATFMGDTAAAAAESQAPTSPSTPAAPALVSPGSGLVPRFAVALFDALSKKPSNSSVIVQLEIIDTDDVHAVTDLQAKRLVVQGPRAVDPEPIKVREEPQYGAVAYGAVRTPVSNAAEFMSTVKSAFAKYRKSRGKTPQLHFILAVRCQETLTFADPHNPNEQITKTSHASSMFALIVARPVAFFRCIDTVASKAEGTAPVGSTAKVPFRDSSLTRMVQEFFGGNAHPHVFTCVSPHYSHAKDVSPMLDVAAKMTAIRCYPRHCYDETTSEFRRLDKEMNHLSNELSATTEAYQIIQNELDSRYAALNEAKMIHAEQQMALDDIGFEIVTEAVLIQVKKQRLQRIMVTSDRREADLEAEVDAASTKATSLESNAAIAVAAAAASSATAQANRATIEALKATIQQNQETIQRQEARYQEVAECKQGLGGQKDAVEAAHKERVGDKPQQIVTMKEEVVAVEAKTKALEMPLRMAQLALKSIHDSKKRLEEAQAHAKTLDDEEAQLNQEIADLEKEVAQMEKDAEPDPSCCIVA